MTFSWYPRASARGASNRGAIAALRRADEAIESMAVLLETSLGDICIDLEVDQAPMACKNFIKLCKVRRRRSRRVGFKTHTHTPLLSNAALFDSFLLILVEFAMLRAAELSTPTGQSLQQLHLLQRPARLHRTNGRSDQHREGRRVGVPVRLPRPVFRRRTHRTLSLSLDRKAYGEQAKYFEDEIRPTLKHTSMGTVGMASVGENLNCSQARSRHCRGYCGIIRCV
jgi:hypothetical protein